MAACPTLPRPSPVPSSFSSPAISPSFPIHFDGLSFHHLQEQLQVEEAQLDGKQTEEKQPHRREEKQPHALAFGQQQQQSVELEELKFEQLQVRHLEQEQEQEQEQDEDKEFHQLTLQQLEAHHQHHHQEQPHDEEEEFHQQKLGQEQQHQGREEEEVYEIGESGELDQRPHHQPEEEQPHELELEFKRHQRLELEEELHQDDEKYHQQRPLAELDEKEVRPGTSSICQSPSSLLPGLPNPVALHCLARIPRGFYPSLKAVSRCWREALSGSEIYSVRKELGCTESWIFLSFSPRTFYSDRVRNWVEAYDPVGNLWKPICWLPGLADEEMLKGFGFVGLNGRFYVIGGRLCTKTFSSPVEIDVEVRADVMVYDCFANKWSQCASMSTPRVDFACAVCNGRIYVVGGRSVAGHEKGVASAEVYDPLADRWYSLPKMSTRRYKCVGVTFKDKVYVIGGFTSSENSQRYSLDVFALNRSSVEIYDPARDRWEFVKGMWQLDVPPYQVVNLEGQLYSSGDVLNSWKGHIEVYDEALNMWKAVQGSRRCLREDPEGEGLLALRRYVTMAPIGNRLFFLEGYCKMVEHLPFCFDRVVTFNATGDSDIVNAAKWEAFEPLHKSCRDLCSHCCVVEA